MAPPQRQMQMLVTRFERLSRRISLAGLMSNHRAVEAIGAGRVRVDGATATSNFKVFSEASVTVDGLEAPAPEPMPRLWALFKPRKVLCQTEEKEGEKTLRSIMREWRNREVRRTGTTQAVGLDDECLDDKHFVIVSGLAYGSDGLVLLTNDGLFAKALSSKENRILTAYDVKIAGDPPVDMLHSWRRRAKVGGIDYGQVFCSITRRNGTTTKLRVRLVESPDRPVDLLFERARMNVYRIQRHAFGPYAIPEIPLDRVVQVPVHKSLKHLCPVADMRQALVPAPGSVITGEGRIRSVGLHGSVVAPDPEFAEQFAQEQLAPEPFAPAVGAGAGVGDPSSL